MDLNGQSFSRYKAFVRQVSSISPDVSITIFLMTYPNRLYTGWFTWFAIHIHDDLCVYRYVQIHIDMYRYVQICICMYRYVYGQMCIDMYGFFCTKQAWLLFFLHKICTTQSECHSCSQNLLDMFRSNISITPSYSRS